jgi:hypothetical protein
MKFNLNIFFLALFLCSVQAQILSVGRTFELNKVHYVTNIPGGAPPTNDGYAYANVAYDKFYLYMAGQNGYDVCGIPLPIEPTPYPGATTIPTPYPKTSHTPTPYPIIYNITPRVVRTFYNIKAILECFNEEFTQIPGTSVFLSYNSTFPNRIFENEYYANNRAIVNKIQRMPEFWGEKGDVMTRFIAGIQWLSLGDVVEVFPEPIPRTNEKPTCIETGIPPPTAVMLLEEDRKAGRYPCPK